MSVSGQAGKERVSAPSAEPASCYSSRRVPTPPRPPQRFSQCVAGDNAGRGPCAASGCVQWTQRAQQDVPVPPPPVVVAKRIVPTPPPPPLRYIESAVDVGNHVDTVHNEKVVNVVGRPVDVLHAGVILPADRVEESVTTVDPAGGASPCAAVTAVAPSVGLCAMRDVATPPQYTRAAPGRAVCGRVGTVPDQQVASGVVSPVLRAADAHQQHAAVGNGRRCLPSVAPDVALVTAPAGSVLLVEVPSSSLRADAVVFVPAAVSSGKVLAPGAASIAHGPHRHQNGQAVEAPGVAQVLGVGQEVVTHSLPQAWYNGRRGCILALQTDPPRYMVRLRLGPVIYPAPDCVRLCVPSDYLAQPPIRSWQLPPLHTLFDEPAHPTVELSAAGVLAHSTPQGVLPVGGSYSPLPSQGVQSALPSEFDGVRDEVEQCSFLPGQGVHYASMEEDDSVSGDLDDDALRAALLQVLAATTGGGGSVLHPSTSSASVPSAAMAPFGCAPKKGA